jgi:DNA polymerase III delta prime subunit
MPAATLWERLIGRARQRALPPSLILVSADPMGGLEEAAELARQGLCTEDGRSGCMCWDCRLQSSGNHPDVVTLKPDPSSIKVENIREIRLEAQKPPFQGSGKYFILHCAHKMTPGAANALLKVLEEPGPGVHFLLLTSQPLLLPSTIRSRCFNIPLPQAAEFPEPAEDLRLAWERWKTEKTEASRLQFLKRLSLEEHSRIPCALLGLWRRDPTPVLVSLAQAYLQVFASTPPTFNRQQALEALAADLAFARPLPLSPD